MGKFVIKKASNGQYYFVIKAGNGEIIATSELYITKESCHQGIESVRKHAPDATIDDRTNAWRAD